MYSFTNLLLVYVVGPDGIARYLDGKKLTTDYYEAEDFKNLEAATAAAKNAKLVDWHIEEAGEYLD